MPSSQVIDLIYSHEGEFGWTVRSPQVPGLIGGRPTWKELGDDVRSMLSFAGIDPATLEARAHVERTISVPAGDVTIRVAGDEHREERETTALRVAAALNVPSQQEQMLSVPRTATGEILYICVVPSDTVRWVVNQFGESGDAAAVALNVAEQLIFTTHFVSGTGDPDAPTLESFGFSVETTMGEMMAQTEIGSVPRRVLLPV